jgi:ribosomal protein L21E
MGDYREGQKVKATKTIHRSGGSAWPGQTGRVVKKTGDGYVVRFDNGGWEADVVKGNEIDNA